MERQLEVELETVEELDDVFVLFKCLGSGSSFDSFTRVVLSVSDSSVSSDSEADEDID